VLTGVSLSASLRLHPTYVHAMNNLGNIRKERSELTEAERLLAKAVSIQYAARRAATADAGAPEGAPPPDGAVVCLCSPVQAGLRRGVDESGYRSEQPAEV